MLVDPQLPLGHYRLTFRANEGWRLPPFAGDMWRRALVSAVHDLALRDDRLGGTGDVADYLFHSTPGPWAQKMRQYRTVPNPVIIRHHDLGPRLVRPGDAVRVDIVLIGHANRFLGALLQAAQAAAQKGLGFRESRGGATLSAVHQIDLEIADTRPLTPGTMMGGGIAWTSPPCPPAPTGVTVHLITPLRVRNGDDDGEDSVDRNHSSYIEDPARLDARSVLMTLVRRISMLSYFHTEHPLDTDFASLKRLAQATALSVDGVAFEALQRPETRRNPAEARNGLVGRFPLAMGAGNPFWPYLWLGRWVGVGHGANVGLGTIALEVDP